MNLYKLHDADIQESSCVPVSAGQWVETEPNSNTYRWEEENPNA